jgi:hypothetical protein
VTRHVNWRHTGLVDPVGLLVLCLDRTCFFCPSFYIRAPDPPYTITSTVAFLLESVVGATGVGLIDLLKVPDSLLTPEYLLLTPSVVDDLLSRRASLIGAPPRPPNTSFLDSSSASSLSLATEFVASLSLNFFFPHDGDLHLPTAILIRSSQTSPTLCLTPPPGRVPFSRGRLPIEGGVYLASVASTAKAPLVGKIPSIGTHDEMVPW